jgi:flagellar assembly protein FliH
MPSSPPRKPGFLSSVPAQQQVQIARFGQPSAPAGPPQIRPMISAPQAPGAKELPPSESRATAPGAAQTNASQPALAAAAPTMQLTPPAAPAPNQMPAAPAQNMGIPLDLVRSRLAASIEALRFQSEKLAEQARADTLEIAFQIARRIVEVEVRQSPDALFALVRTSLSQLATARRITLRVSAGDLEALRSPRGKEVTQVSLAEIELAADASLEPGECLIESDLGQIDGRLANRFSELRRHVEEAAEGAA